MTPATNTKDNDAIWYLYILRCEGHTLYTGITTDVKRRFGEHLAGEGKGAKYTQMAKPKELAYSLPIGSKDIAARMEHRIKQLSKEEKEAVVAARFDLVALLRYLKIEDWI